MFSEAEALELKNLLGESCNSYPNIVESVDEENKSFGFFQVVFMDDRLNNFTEQDWINHIRGYEERTGLEYMGDAVDTRYNTRIRMSYGLEDEEVLCINELIVGKGNESYYYYILALVEECAKKNGYKGIKIALNNINDYVTDAALNCLDYKHEEQTVREVIAHSINTGKMAFKTLVHYF